MGKKIIWGLWGSCCGLGILLFSSQAVHADISGKVFRDFNSNGTFDTGVSFNEVGMPGVSVKAFDADDVPASPTATAISDSAGSYVLTGLTTGVSYRVEFSWGQSWLKPGAAGGTTVQFVKDGASNIDVAVNNPAQYCQANPDVATTRMIPDDQVTKPTVLSFDYDSTGDNRSTLTELAHGSDKIGSTWGVAYRRDTKKLYVSSVLRRHTSEGSLGFGGIYELDTTNPSTAPVSWLTITDAGSMIAPREIPIDGGPSHDIEAYLKVGKMSLGDIDISEDGKTLYVMNLNTRSLVPVDIDSKTQGTPVPVGDPGCASADDVRPWAVKVQDGEVYVGVVCSNESLGSVTSTFKAYVMKLAGSSFTPVASMALNYEKDWVAPGEWPNKNACEAQRGWFPWSSNPAAFTSFTGCRTDLPNVALHPQPILSDIEFDVDGSIILGFLDRLSMEVGDNNYAPDVINTNVYGGFAGGDIRRICNVNGNYVAEGNAGCAFNGGQNLSLNNEFYVGDHILYSWDGQVSSIEPGHSETSLGSLALRAGSGEVLVNVYDPMDDLTGSNNRWGTNGTRWLSNTTGEKQDAFEIISISDQDFGKVAGLGDLELMCDEPPVEVGNRIWNDADGDGIQDADETGIDGVEVILTCGSDTATATTSNGGKYLFSNAGNATFLAAGKTCTIVADGGQTPLAGLDVTLQNADGVSDNNETTDLRDSDATSAGQIVFTVGDVGVSNHTLDIGYKTAPVVSVDVTLIKSVEPATARHGDTVVYTLIVTNTGADTATGVKVMDKLPDGLTFVSHDGASPGVYDAVTGEWNVGTVGVGAANAVTLKITATVK